MTMTEDPIRSLKPCPYLHINPPIFRENELFHGLMSHGIPTCNIMRGKEKRTASLATFTTNQLMEELINFALCLCPFTGSPLFYR